MNAETQKATRQPQDRNWSAGRIQLMPSSTRVASRLPDRNRGLRPAGPEAAGFVGAVLGHQQDRSAPLAAHGEALDEAQDHQQCRRPVADGVEAGQAAHQERCHADHDDGDLQRVLAAELVADLAEYDAAQRAGNEAHRIGQERRDDAVEFRAGVREEEFAEDQRGGGGVEEELVPLHHRAHHRGGHDLFQSRCFGFRDGHCLAGAHRFTPWFCGCRR